MHRELPKIRARGAELQLVGNGNRRFAMAFKDELRITCPLFVDPKLEAYRAFEMKRGGLAGLASLALWKNTARALRAGFLQTSTKGDAWQLGGVVVVLPGGLVSFLHRSEVAGDHPRLEDVLDALPPP